MSAMFARLPARVTLPLFAMLTAIAAGQLPDLDTIREWLRRIQQIIVLGGVALALGCSLVFIGAWVLSFLRRAKPEVEGEEPAGPGWTSRIALWVSFVPVALTVVAALAMFLPLLKPLILKIFVYAVVAAAVSWVVSIAAVIVGGGKQDLARARRALLLAGTPFYCLAIWIARFLAF